MKRDVFEEFMDREIRNQGVLKDEDNGDASIKPELMILTESKRALGQAKLSTKFKRGCKINHIVVDARIAGESGPGGMYQCHCGVVRDGKECGKGLKISYRTLYTGSVFSCGCLLRAKHPPIRLEGSRQGNAEVLRWSEEDAAWEVICHACGNVLYLKTAKEVRAAGLSCVGHSKG